LDVTIRETQCDFFFEASWRSLHPYSNLLKDKEYRDNKTKKKKTRRQEEKRNSM
jgi:hypothetical protein